MEGSGGSVGEYMGVEGGVEGSGGDLRKLEGNGGAWRRVDESRGE